jgi:hypothetical protein
MTATGCLIYTTKKQVKVFLKILRKNIPKHCIDLSVSLKLQNNITMALIRLKLEDLPIIYNIEAINEAEIASGDFKNEYERSKKLFY